MFTLAAALSIAAIGADHGEGQMSRFRPVPDAAPATARAPAEAGKPSPTRLPYARGRRFATLDAYLAFRREQGAIDLPWYEEVAPDMFELRTTMKPAPAPQRFSRAELAKKFGFAR